MRLKLLFEIVEKKAYLLRKNNSNANGQDFWKPIKDELSRFNIQATGWKKIKNEYQKILLLPEYNIDGNGVTSIIEVNHFIIQTIRIPINEEPSLRKIIQVALNIGQYTGLGFTKEPWMNLENYLTQKNIKKIDAYITPELIEKISNL